MFDVVPSDDVLKTFWTSTNHKHWDVLTFDDILNGFIYIEENDLHVLNLPKVDIRSKNDHTIIIFCISGTPLEF